MKTLYTCLFGILLFLSCTKEAITTLPQSKSPNLASKTTSSTNVTYPVLYVQLLLNLQPGLENTGDGVALTYSPSWTIFPIGNEDSWKWENPDENLAINEHGRLLSMEGKPMPIKDSTFLEMWTFRQTDYYLQIFTKDFPAGYTARIYDRKLKKSTPINLYTTTNIPFTADSTYRFRYKLYIKKP